MQIDLRALFLKMAGGRAHFFSYCSGPPSLQSLPLKTSSIYDFFGKIHWTVISSENIPPVQDALLHICLICVEIFAWGKHGGFGRATRVIGRELVRRGIQVSAVIPRREDQAAVEMLDGIRVLGFNRASLADMVRVMRACGADIYHSQEPSFGTHLAQQLHPEKKHVVTFRDTRMFADWWTEFRLPSLHYVQVLSNWLYEDNLFVHRAVRRADRRFIASRLLGARAVEKYRLTSLPEFLPTPVAQPVSIQKDPHPTACYIARWDRRKRPELFVRLAEAFPQVHFIMAGDSRDQKFDRSIQDQAVKLPNVEMAGFINQFEDSRFSEILSRSWVMVNTAAREGLPNAFIEACAHRCAILSSVNPDDFSSRFGYHAAQDDFGKGLEYLLADHRWQEKADLGNRYFLENFELEKAVQKHVDVYRGLLSGA